MKKIVLINQVSGYLFIDIANAFSSAGYDVILIAGSLVPRNTPLNNVISFDKIIKYNRNSVPSRIYSWVIGFIQILFKIWFKYRNHELFIVSNPPLAPMIPLFCKNKFSLLIFDVYIEKPEELPVLKNMKILTSFWRKAHSKVFSKAERIFTLTEGMQQTILKYSGKKSAEIVPIWTDNEFLKPVPIEENPFIKEHHLENKFLILYSGNIGTSSGVEMLVNIAAEIISEKIQFVIIGEGIRKKSIEEKVRALGLTNCILLPWQETDILPFSLASANLSVVSLSAGTSKNAIPSKLYNYMSVGSPILGLADSDSDLARLIEFENIGKCFEPSKINDIISFILLLFEDSKHCSLYSKNSLLASKKFTVSNVAKFLPKN